MSSTRSEAPLRKAEILALAAITVAGAALRLWLVDARPLHGAEGMTWYTSGRRLSQFLSWMHHADHPPLSFVLVRLSIETLGRTVWALRLPSVIAGILCIPAAWALGRRLRIGMPLAALVAFDPALVVLSSIARMYGLLALLVLVALWRLDRLAARGERGAGAWLVLGAILLAATWTHYLGYALAVSVVAAIALRTGARPAALAAIPPLVGVVGPLQRAIRVALRGGPTPVDRFLPDTIDHLPFGSAIRLVIDRAFDLWPVGILSPLVVLAGLLGLAVLARRAPPLGIALGALAVLTLVSVIAGAPKRWFGIDRYLVPWRIAVSTGLAALGLMRFRASPTAAGVGAALLALLGIRAAAPTRPSDSFAQGALARALGSRVEPGDVVVFGPPAPEWMGRWYGLPVIWVEREPSFPRRSDGSLPSRTWVIVSGRTDAPPAPGLGSGGKSPGRDLDPDFLPAVEAAYGARVDPDALDPILRAKGVAAIEFTAGAARIHAVGR